MTDYIMFASFILYFIAILSCIICQDFITKKTKLYDCDIFIYTMCFYVDCYSINHP